MGPQDGVEPLAEELAECLYPVMIVRHLPFLARLAGEILVGDPEGQFVRFRNAGLVGLARGAARWRLVCVLPPELAIGQQQLVRPPRRAGRHFRRGGMAYVGWERSHDYATENLTTCRMRHAAGVQRSSSGNVIRRSTFHGSDARPHAGWTNENLFEQCVWWMPARGTVRTVVSIFEWQRHRRP